MTSISVALATYNGAPHLREQLNSIAAQTLRPAELVITDDASDDGTVAIAEAFARTAPFPVRVHRNPVRLGYRANFMHNVALCSGDLIALCDQDDVWDPAKLATMAAACADPEVLLAFHEAWLMDADGKRGELARIYPLPTVNPPLSLFPMRNPFGFSMVFRRTLLSLSDLWEQTVDNLEAGNRMAHDQWFFFLASVFGTIAFVDTPLAGYRQHGNNTYGIAPRARSARARMQMWIDQATEEYASFAVAAERRAAILKQAALRFGGRWAAQAETAEASYRDFARRCALRADAYRSRGLRARLAGWFRMVRGDVYSRRVPWALGRKALLTDLIWLAAAVRRTGRPQPVSASTSTRADIRAGTR